MVLSLPFDHTWTGGGLTVWEGIPEQTYKYPMNVGDICFIDNFVYHQVSGTCFVPTNLDAQLELAAFNKKSKLIKPHTIGAVEKALQAFGAS